MENAAQLPAGMFADCHFHLTCSFSLLSSPPHPDLETEHVRSPRFPLPSRLHAAEIGLNGDTLSTKATSGVGRPCLSAVKLWIILISSENDADPTFFEGVLWD